MFNPSGGCPGAKMQFFDNQPKQENQEEQPGQRSSELRQWPVQFHLVSPKAPYFQGADVLLSADCVSYALADFHKDYLKGRGLAIACPKLDSNQELYAEKLIQLVDEAKINTLTVMIMQVPCCSGLLAMAKNAVKQAKRQVPVKAIVVSIQGEILSEEWV